MGWADAAYQLHLSSQQHVKFILPNAPVQPVTLNMGLAMPSWYDITSLDDRANQECEGIESAREMVTALIEREVASGIPLSRIVVGGFSQGGALALYTGMQYDGQLAGVCCMSGCKAARPRTLRSRLAVSTSTNARVPPPTDLPKDHAFTLAEAARATPVAHFHGKDDPTVRLEWARQSQQKLLDLGATTYTLTEYEGMGHSACPEEFADLAQWLQQVLPAEE